MIRTMIVILAASAAFAQQQPEPLKARVVNTITSSATVISNVSALYQNTAHTFCATGTGTWSVQIQYSDSSSSGPFTNFLNPGSQVTNNSATCVGIGIGYHSFIEFSFTGAASVNYAGTNYIFLAPPFTASGVGTVTNVSVNSLPSWLSGLFTNSTTTPDLSISPATGQTSHQVIGTCGNTTTFTPCSLTTGDLPSGIGTVTDVTVVSVPAWLTAAFANGTTTPALTVSVATGQTSHEVIGTCGSATTFGPCSLTTGDLPSGTGTVTDVTVASAPAWLTAAFANGTTTPALTISASTGQTSHEVIGTCGSATAFSPCALVLGDLPSIGAGTFMANNTVSTAAPIAITATQATAMLNVFSSSLQGLVPASNGGTTNFLRADGNFAAPSGTSIFSSYQFGNQTALTGSGLYIQTVYPTLFTTTQTGSGSSGSPYIDTVGLATQSANTFLRGPTSGSPAPPSFGVLVAADLPAIVVQTNQSNTWSTGLQSMASVNGSIPWPVYTSSGSLPSSCVAGQGAFVTASAAGQQIWECSSTNTWTQQLNSGGGVASFSQLTDSMVTDTTSVLTLAAGGINVNGSPTIYSTTATITVNSGTDTGVFGIGYNASALRVCWVDSGTITLADYTVSSGFSGSACTSSIPANVLIVAKAQVTGGAFSTVTNYRVATNAYFITCGANLTTDAFGCAFDPTQSLTLSQPLAFGVGSSIASASTISPTYQITPVSGTATIQTIPAPASFAVAGNGGCLTLISNGAWSTGTSGNISTAFTATSGNAYAFCYNAATSLWSPQGSAGGGGGGTTTETIWLPIAMCNSTASSGYPGWTTTTAANCFTSNALGYNLLSGSGAFGTAQTIVPHGYSSGTVNLTIFFSTFASFAASIEVSTLCLGNGSTIAAMPNSPQTISWTAAGGSATTMQTQTLSAVTMTGCSADNMLLLQFNRTDSVAQNIYFFGAELTIVRAL